MVKFLLYRSIPLFAAVLMLFFILYNKAHAAGLFMGYFLTIIKIHLLDLIIKKLVFNKSGKKTLPIIALALSSISIMLLILAAVINFHFFIGAVSGYGVIILFIIINTITEAAHISHNNWGDG